MKYFIHAIFALLTLIMSSNVLADRPLTSNVGVINGIDHKKFIMVIDDRKVYVDKKVKVHSEFVYNDYFSRLKRDMKIKFTLIKKGEISVITEIWVQ